MSSTYGENLKLTVFGQSHGPAIGMTLDAIPAGLPVDEKVLAAFMARRAPGNNAYSTSRKETDQVKFLSGIVDGYTCGAPIAAIIENQNTRSSDYDDLKDHPRPGHADFTAQVKYGGFQDVAGGGHFSGRLTAPICIAGGLCIQWLEEMGIQIRAHLFSVGTATDASIDMTSSEPIVLQEDFPVISKDSGIQMQQQIAQAKESGDSLGGCIECIVTGLPAGIGEPMFGGMEGRLALALYGIPAVKAVEFGAGMKCASMRGSEHNDPYSIENGAVKTSTNNAGGILGGITNGMPLVFRVGIKPTPSIAMTQKTVSLSSMTDDFLQIKGRHDPCIAPRAVSVVEAAAAIAIYDAVLGNTQTKRRK